MPEIRRRRRVLASQLRCLLGAAPEECHRSQIKSVLRESAKLRVRFNVAKKRQQRRAALTPVLS